MNLASCLIVDDDLNFVSSLTAQLEKFGFLRIAGHCKTYSEAIVALNSSRIDLLFLDIKLGGPEGLDGFDLLRQYPHLPPVIVVSSSPHYAVESYSIGKAKDFLVKPIDRVRLAMSINRALETDIEIGRLIDKNSIFLKMGRKFQRFSIDDILYIEGYGIYSKVITEASTSYIVNDSLTELESMLKEKKFMRVHKSYIINLNKLTGFDSKKIYLVAGSVPIGASYKSKLEGLFRLFDSEFYTDS